LLLSYYFFAFFLITLSELVSLSDFTERACERVSIFPSSEYGWKSLLPTSLVLSLERKNMTNTKFLVRVNRSGTRAPEYVQRIDRTPIQTTTNRKLALAMGRFTAEDAVKSIQNSRCTPELISVQVSA
jgi:hypothetical protein